MYDENDNYSSYENDEDENEAEDRDKIYYVNIVLIFIIFWASHRK